MTLGSGLERFGSPTPSNVFLEFRNRRSGANFQPTGGGTDATARPRIGDDGLFYLGNVSTVGVVEAEGSPRTMNVTAALSRLPFATFVILDPIRRVAVGATDRFEYHRQLTR